MKRKIGLIILAVTLIMVTIISIFKYGKVNTYSSQLATTKGNLSEGDSSQREVILSNGYATKSIPTVMPVIKENTYDTEGIDIIKKASELLGTGYHWGYKGSESWNVWDETTSAEPKKDTSEINLIDCSGLVWWTLSSLGMQTSGFKLNHNVPVDTTHWLQPRLNNEWGNYFCDVTAWKYDTIKREWTENDRSSLASVKDTVLQVRRDENAWKNVNILKINDPIDSNLRYWEYYDSDNNKKELPMGTVIISYGSGLGNRNNDHAWIYIGNLGTRAEAVEKLKAMKIECDFNDENIIKDYGNGCTHWRIESAGGTGVTINNGDPDYGAESYDGSGRIKGIGPIWAFQVANDYSISGNYQMNVSKKDADSTTELDDYSDALEGAEIEIKQYKNNSSDETGESHTKTVNGNKTEVLFNEDSNITIDEISTNDTYIISEITAPDGYKINNGNIKLEVAKKIGTNVDTGKLEYQISKVNVYDNSNDSLLAELEPGNKEILTLKTTDTETGNVIGIEISTNAITVTYKDEKEEKDVNVVVDKKSIDGKNVNNVNLKYWVFDSEGDIPNENNLQDNRKSQDSMSNPFSIEKMRRGDVKYVWLTEESNNDNYGNGFFEITDDLRNEGVTCRYIRMKVECGKEDGVISVTEKELCQIKNNEKESLDSNCADNIYTDSENNQKNYVNVNNINVEDGNPAKITVPIINPYNSVEYSIGLGKKLAKGKVSEYSYPQSIEEAKDEFSDTTGLMAGAEFSVQQCFENSDENSRVWSDKKTVTTEDRGYIDITGDELPANYNRIWYKINETKSVEGGKLNQCVYYVKIDNYTKESITQNNVTIDVYKDPEINQDTNLPNSDAISNKWQDDDGNRFVADKDDGFMVYYGSTTKNIQFIMVDENITKKYNVNLAKINKDDINNFSLEELNSNSIKDKMVGNVSFDVKQEKRTKNERLTGEDKKTVTTVNKDYTSVYEDVSIKPDNHEIYTIKETSAPSEYVIYDKEITMTVYNDNKSDDEIYSPRLVYISVDFDGDGSINSNEEIVLTTNKNFTNFSSHNVLNNRIYGMIDDTGENVNITLILADEKYKGSYNIDLVKKELKDNQEDNYKNENAKFISTLSNAKYSIDQVLNNPGRGDGQFEINSSEITTEKGKISTIANGVDINDIRYPDTYLIEEIDSPASYNINKLKLKLDIYKYKSQNDNKYKINYIIVTDVSRKFGRKIENGKTLYINDTDMEKNYFSNYIVAVSLKENSEGNCTIEVTWRNDQPTYDIYLEKTNATTGEKVTASGDVTAKFDIKLYSDKEFNTLADFKNKDGDDLNQQEYETDDDSEINLKNIIMPDVKTGETITNYLAITETSITDSSYKMFEGTLIIPITFTRNENGKITQYKGDPYVINNITEKQKIEGKINGDGDEEIDNEKLIVLDTNNVVTVVVPNQKSGEISLQLIKEGKNLKGDTLVKYLNGAKFEISIDNVNENGDILENLYKTSSDQPEITGQYGNQGRIIVNNLPIKPDNILKINIKEVETIEGYTIPDELKTGITYTARVTTDVNNDIVISIDDTEYTESEIKLSNKWINIYVNNIKDAYPGKYKVNLTKKGEDGDILEGVTFERTGLINKDESSSDTKYNRIVDKKDFTTNSNGVTCITDELGESLSDLDGDDGYVKVPVKDYISASDEYVISESDLGDYENKYVKLNKPITVSIEKGAELHQNKAYANKILLSIDINDVSKAYVLINLLTNKYRTWTGTYSDFKNAPEKDYNKDEITIEVQDENGLTHKILVSGELSEDCSETTFSIVVVNPRQPIPGQYKVNIKKVGTDGTALDGVVFHRIAQLNVDQTAETVGKTVDTDMDETSNGGYASVTKDVETEDSELITVSKDNYETIDKYEINEQSLGKNDGKYNKYPYSIYLVVEKEYKGYKASASKVKLTIDNKTEEIDLSNSTASSKKTITVKDSNDEEIDVVMNASIENNEVTITLTIENSELTSVPVEKRWVDGDDENNLRPNSIEVELKYKKDGNFVKYEKNGVENPVTLNLGNNWKYTWNKLPKNINGEVAEYTVEETEIPSDYTVNKTTTEEGVIVLTNSHTVTEIVNKSKRWKNVEDADLYGVDMELYKEGETTKIGDTKFVIGNGTATWDNQKKYDDEGNLIKYVVKETQAYYRTDKNSENWIELEKGKDYVADENGGVFINTLITPGKYTIMLSKIDNGSQQGISGVTFKVNNAVTKPTGNDGITYVNDEVNIDEDNVNDTDTYKITEITTKDDYYKINGSLTVNVTKKKTVEDNNSITYKLNTVYFEDGTIDDNGVAKKTVTLENNDEVEVTAEIVDNIVRITIPNEKKKGTYSLKIIKYKIGTETPVPGAKFNLIGGNIGNLQLEKDGEQLSEENYSEIVTSTKPVAIWDDVINIRDIAKPDTFTLKEVGVGDNNTDMFVGFTEPIKITINKNNNYNVERIGLTVGDNEATEQNGKLVFNKTIDNQKIEARLSLNKDTNTITLEVENPEKHGSFNFNLVKYIKGTTTPLNGAGFKIKIVNTDTNTCVQDSNGNDIDGTKEIFVENGQISIDNINIAKAGITYEITIEESTVPEGYIGLDEPITFTAVSESNADGKTYTLVPNKSTTIPNTRSVVVNENEINVEIDNSPFTEVEKEKLWENVKNANLYGVEMKLYKKDETNPIDNTTKYVIGNGKAIWENLDKYDAGGNIIEYVVKETQAYYRTDENSENWIELEKDKDYVADEEEGVFINTVITPGKYTVMLSKVDKDSNKAIFGVTFKVNDVLTDHTGATGTTYVKDKDGNRLEVNIDKDNVGVTDTYEITEINLNNKENDYYKIADPLKVNVTKKRLEENNQIIYKLDSVSFDNGLAKKTVELENGDKVEVTAEIVGSTVKITIPNIKKKGTYSLKLIKYKKGTQTPVAGAKFNIIGGNIGNNQLMQNNAPLSEDNYSQIITKTEPVAIWQESVNIRDIDTPDTYTLKEVDVGEDNTDMFVGFTEPIKITLNKNSSYNIESIGLTVGTEEAKKDSSGNLIFEKTIDNQTVEARLSLDKNTNTVILEVENPEKHGSFNLNLVKYIKGTTTPLNGAGFKIKIESDKKAVEDINGNAIDGTKEIFVENGQISIDNINIAKAGITYEITIEESTVPEGYIGLDEPITFTAVSESNADGKTYTLVPNKSTTISNAKLVDVRENEILVEVENKVKPTIHKGVKDVENQSSGYHNEITGDTYESEEDAKKVLHDWVINTTLPNGVDEYSIYEISDKIDDRLTYEGVASVKIIDGKNTVADLVERTDYKVAYDEASRMLKITFIGQDQAISETVKNNIGKTIEVRFNTKFALDDNGNIIALNQSVPNQATLTYGNGSTVESEKPEVHTGGVGLFKYDEKTGKALSGAHFKIATSKENAEKGIFLKDTKGNDVEKITNEKGIAVFEGLEFGEDALNKAEYKTIDETTKAEVYKYDWTKVETTYYIVETESPEGYGKIEEPIEAIVKKDNYNIEDITTLIKVGNSSNIYDLSLRKFITAVKDTAKGTEEEVTSRIPQVDLTKLANGESTTATYTHPKDPVLVHTTDIVTYTIRIYNEGPQDAYASIVKDDIPDGLQFVQYTEGDGSLNAEYRWKLVDENDNEVTDVSKAKYIVTDYLSKEQDKTPGANLLKGYEPDTMSELDYRDVKVQFKVTEPTTSDRILINYAQISKETDSSGNIVKDRDSTPNKWIDSEDDQDIEKVRVQYFDLALRKWVTQAIVTENGKTVVTETGHKAEDNPEEVVKVDLKKSKINNVTVKFKYSIRITNEGEIAGEATEIRDDIPNGLKFVAEDNPDWREENGQIVTNKLEHTTLQPGESAEVEIVLTWINGTDNMGVMINTAEINKDHNEYGTPDIDSTPGNNVPGEDDIDDAPVMLTVKTESDIVVYMILSLTVLGIIASGVTIMRKKVIE